MHASIIFLHTDFLHLCPLSWYLFVHVCVQHFQDDIVAKGKNADRAAFFPGPALNSRPPDNAPSSERVYYLLRYVERQVEYPER